MRKIKLNNIQIITKMMELITNIVLSMINNANKELRHQLI